MDILSAFVIIVLSGGIHATFQLSVSVLTLLSGQKISQNSSHRHLMKLASAMILGVFLASGMIFASIAFLLTIFNNIILNGSKILWAAVIGLLVGSATSVLFFYYRSKKSGTELWLPRSLANFISKKSHKTTHAAEAFSLGVSSVLAEFIFLLPLFLAGANTASKLNYAFQFVAFVAYIFIANFPLFVIYCLISGGHPLLKIQKWRERNKRFLQVFASFGLVILAFYVFITIFGENL